MNLQQLEYVVAVDKFRHFARAADECYVTQATLSMMIKKLEQELDIILFDRSKQPVVPTEAGVMVIE
ncbi:MAG TPA: LysR family transcriptional regulator, partial [Flavisolibacter sp.]|nr:LysR family transcriptional regulator [Flavisolibacter sp.]